MPSKIPTCGGEGGGGGEGIEAGNPELHAQPTNLSQKPLLERPRKGGKKREGGGEGMVGSPFLSRPSAIAGN